MSSTEQTNVYRVHGTADSEHCFGRNRILSEILNDPLSFLRFRFLLPETQKIQIINQIVSCKSDRWIMMFFSLQ